MKGRQKPVFSYWTRTELLGTACLATQLITFFLMISAAILKL